MEILFSFCHVKVFVEVCCPLFALFYRQHANWVLSFVLILSFFFVRHDQGQRKTRFYFSTCKHDYQPAPQYRMPLFAQLRSGMEKWASRNMYQRPGTQDHTVFRRVDNGWAEAGRRCREKSGTGGS